MKPDRIAWPPKSSFEPPRYPNAWFYVSKELAPTYRAAAGFVRDALINYAGFEDSLSPGTNPECADGQLRVHHVQPVTGLPDPARDHHHDLHIRFYFGHLPPRGQHETALAFDAAVHPCWRLAASVHYEPEPEHPGHPYIDECPVCGVVPPYDMPGDRCERSHDPLGLELLLFGTVRDVPVARADGQPVGGLRAMAADYRVEIELVEPQAPDMNTLRLGVVVIMPRRDVAE